MDRFRWFQRLHKRGVNCISATHGGQQDFVCSCRQYTPAAKDTKRRVARRALAQETREAFDDTD